MFAAKNELFTRPSGGYQISRSLRFNSADSAYLNRTPASASNRRTWTWSAWIKRSKITSTEQNLFTAYVSNGDRTWFGFPENADTLNIYDPAGINLATSAVYRDVSAWYHIVLLVDTTQATDTNRIKLYVNNVQQTQSGTYPSQNFDTRVDSNVLHLIGSFQGSSNYFNGYMTEINLIDGQALTPSSFGQTDA